MSEETKIIYGISVKAARRRRTGPFIKERKTLMGTIYSYKVNANFIGGKETTANRRIANQAAKVAEHIEARDVLMALMTVKKEMIEAIKKDFTGVDLVGMGIALVAQSVYEEDLKDWIENPETTEKDQAEYSFSVIFDPVQV